MLYGYSPAYQRREIVRVNGRGGVNAHQMGPNCSELLLDETAPIVWLCQTDGAGYKTATPYDIAPHVDAPPVDLAALAERISRLEAALNESHPATVERAE